MNTPRRIRIAVQAAFLLLFVFLFLQTESKGNDDLGYPVKLFLDFDPLILITTLLSAHAVAAGFLLSIIVIAVTFIFGRVFCGWICPLGTLNNMVGSLRRSKPRISPRWNTAKYLLLVFLIVSSLFGMQLAGVFDPLSLLIRSFSLAVYPALSSATNAGLDLLYGAPNQSVNAFGEAVAAAVKKLYLPFQQPFYEQGWFIGILFLGVLGLNLLEQRFWCRYLCPLGALLGIFSRWSFLKRSVSEGCNECGACTRVCVGNATPHEKDNWKPTECLYCRNCDDVCPKNAVSFGFGSKQPTGSLNIGRRRVVTAALSGAVAVPLIRTVPLAKQGFHNPALVRPPGSLDEREFLQRCVKCGECMKVCITGGLQPTLMEAGLEGIWSPVLVPKIGYCEYRCTLCGQVCPTGAIKRLTIQEKEKVSIGTAMIDKGRCLPYAHSTPCIVCEEVCPTGKKAIWLEEVTVRDADGNVITVKQPHIDLKTCIGCGICETKCPVIDRPAIYVTSIGETRSKTNKLLL